MYADGDITRRDVPFITLNNIQQAEVGKTDPAWSVLALRSASKSVDDLIKTSKPGTQTSVRTRQFERSGGFDQANKEFDSLDGLTDIKDINTPFGSGRTGTLPDSRQVVVRPGSSNGGPPTLEIQQGKNRIKFRFDE